MAPFHFPVVPRSPRFDCLMHDPKPFALTVKRMDYLCFLEMTEFQPVISLDNSRHIAEVPNRPSQKIDGTV